MGRLPSLARWIEWIEKRGKVTHYVPGPKENRLSSGSEVNSIFRDARGYLWVGGFGAGLDRFDERSGQFRHYEHSPGIPHSLMTNEVVSIYGDPSGHVMGGTVWRRQPL